MRTHRVVRFLLAGLLAATVMAGVSFSQIMEETQRGSFTLPFEAHWASLDLRPGVYSFSINNESGVAIFEVKQGQRQVGWVMATSLESNSPQERDSAANLLCAPRGEAYSVDGLKMPWAGVYRFSIPSTSKKLETNANVSVPVLVAAR